MGGSSSNDSVGGSSSSGSSQSTSNSSNSDKGESFSNAMSNAERPDRAPASSTNDSGSNDTGGGSRSPNDDGGGRSMSNAERPDRAPASSSSGSGSDDTGGGSRSPNDDGGGPSLSNDERPDRAPATPSSGAGTNDPNDRPASPNDNGGAQSERAAGPPGIGAPPSGTTPTDTNPTDTNQGGGQENERGFFEGLADVFTAPPTDASGNPRSTSPVADRLNNTQSYSLDDLRSVFVDDAPLTPEQSQALANGAAVMDGVMIAPNPREQISLYQSDLRLQQRSLEYQRSLLGDTIHPRSPNARKAAEIDEQLQKLAERREVVETVTRPDLATGIEPDILHFDSRGDGQIVVGYGDIGSASHIAVLVPGTGAELSNFPTMEKRSIEAMKALLADPSISSPAVIGYLGYDAPDTIFTGEREALSDELAVRGARALADFVNELPEVAETHVFAHSYASLLAGQALLEGARPDYVHGLGMPGMGFDSVYGQPFQDEVEITHTANSFDPVSLSQFHGAVPPFGAISYPPTGTGHSDDPDNPNDADYFDAEVLRDVIAGRRQPIEVDQSVISPDNPFGNGP